MLKVCVIGLGPIGNRHARLYQERPAGASWWASATSATSAPTPPAARLGVPRLLRRRDDAGRAEAGHLQRGHRRLGVRQRPLPAHPAGAGGRLPRAVREAHLATTSRRPRRWSRRPGRRGRCFGVNLNHRFTPAARAGEAVGGRGPARAPALRQHEHVDQEPERELALLPDQGAAPAHRGRHALLLRRHRGRAVLRHQGAGPQDLVHGAVQHALQERRRWARSPAATTSSAGTPWSAARWPGTGGRFVHRGHVPRGDALPGGQPGEDRLHQPDLRRHARLRGHLPQPHPPLPGAGRRRACRRRTSTAPAPTAWPRRRSWPPPSSRWTTRRSCTSSRAGFQPACVVGGYG